MKILSSLNTFLLLFTVVMLNAFSAPSALLEDKDLNQRNYAAVRIWNTTLTSGEVKSFGHTALQGYKRDKLLFNVSLYPGNPEGIGPGSITRIVPAYWRSAEEDDGEAPDETIKIYSLNLDRMQTEFETIKKSNVYGMVSSGGTTAMFGQENELFARNCSSVVRDILNFGGLPNLFEQQMGIGSHIKYALPGALKTGGEIAAGLVGGALGGGYGFGRGFLGTGTTPFGSGVEGFKSGSSLGSKMLGGVASYVTGSDASEDFSVINYGHPYGQCNLVTPWKVGQLAKDARENEKKKFSKTKYW